MYILTQVQPLAIEYSRIAKKIDVKKVKSKIWSIITISQENDQVCTYICRYVSIMDMINMYCYFSERMYSTIHTYVHASLHACHGPVHTCLVLHTDTYLCISLFFCLF